MERYWNCIIAIVPALWSECKSPAKAGMEGMTTMTLKFWLVEWARTMRSTRAAPIWFLTVSSFVEVEVMKNWFSM